MNSYDILIIGAGLAGLRAAIEAVNLGLSVAIVSKVHPVRSHSNAAQGGINAPLTDRGDNWQDHAFDTIKGSDYLADQDSVEIMSKEAGDAIITLENMGVIFSRNDEGNLGTRRFGGQKQARTFFVGAITGSAILHVLYEQSIKHSLHVYEEWFVTSLVQAEGQVKGVIAMDMRTGKLHPISGRCVIMATGGAGRIYEPSTNALICTGDGLALAWRSGAPLMDMEMVQFHPTTLAKTGILLSEAARGEGAHLLNALGERFMQKTAPDYMELASRDVVSRAEQIEIDEGRGVDGNVLLDLRHLGRSFIENRLGYLQEVALEFLGIDLAEQPVPVKPGMHYIMGGIKTDCNGLTSVPGLYAAGECANVSVHGANRLGANSLLDTVVFGRRCIRHAYDNLPPQDSASTNDTLFDEYTELESKRLSNILSKQGTTRTAHIRNKLANAMTKGIGVFRDQHSMENAKNIAIECRLQYNSDIFVEDKGKVFNTDLIFALELDFMLDVAMAICEGALSRRESRGAHYRTDIPQRSDQEWLKHTIVHKTDDTTLKTDFLPVTITNWQPQARIY